MTSSKPVEILLGRLQNARRSPSGWTARCPAHEDRVNSLSVREGDDGRALVHCFAGCQPQTILEKLGLGLSDLFERPFHQTGRDRGDTPQNPPQPCNRGDNSIRINQLTHAAASATVMQPTEPGGCTLITYSKAKRLPVPFLQELGVREFNYLGRPALRIPYRDTAGQETAVRFRLALDGSDRFRWRQGSKVSLYGLSRLAEARATGHVVLCEGESDAHTLWFHGIPALGLPGAANWREEWAALLDNISTVYVVVEPDRGGETVQRWLGSSRLRDRVRLITLDGFKDPSALHVADPDRFAAHWRAAIDAAIRWTDVSVQQAAQQKAVAWGQCQALANKPRILDTFAEVLERRGVAGEARAAKLIYLAVTSRLLERPISLAVKGPSSAGKSFITEQTLAFFPPRAFHALTSGSERILAYSDQPLKHRMLVIYEACGMAGDVATYLVRSLLSEGRIRYEVVEKTKDGMRPRLIEREGPTGLITTTTATSLHPENETRLFSVPVTDTPDQTRRILLSMAAERRDATDDLSTWRALQGWLEHANRCVTISYAQRLAAQMPTNGVRLRRDFGAVLTLIRTHALLHQASRDQTAGGAVIATLEDYVAVRDLVGELIGQAVEATVSTTIRETVEAVKTLCADSNEPTTVTVIAKHLRLDKSAALRRVKVALAKGYLKNLETGKGRPYRLELGETMPDDAIVLPEPSALEKPAEADDEPPADGDVREQFVVC